MREKGRKEVFEVDKSNSSPRIFDCRLARSERGLKRSP